MLGSEGKEAWITLLIKSTFRTAKPKPKTNIDVLKLYVSLIKAVSHDKFIISEYKNSTKTTRIYKTNTDLVHYHLECDKYANSKYVNYNYDYLDFIEFDYKTDELNNKGMLNNDIFLGDIDDC